MSQKVPTWADLPFWHSISWKEIQSKLKDVNTMPVREDWFAAFVATPLIKTKVVILGEAPYHDGSAHGLAFSTVKESNVPPSLRNIYKEYMRDTGYPQPASGNLSAWAKRGVLLLNRSLTTTKGNPDAHKNLGWEFLVRQALTSVRETNPKAVFILWGKKAQVAADSAISGAPRVESPHPSPFSADTGFFGSRPFTKANALLVSGGLEPIDWRLRSNEKA